MNKIVTIIMICALCVTCGKGTDTMHKEETNNSGKTPITKPEIKLENDTFSPEALWSMGRIGSVAVDMETGWIAYTVTYYSIEENRGTTWIRICSDEHDSLSVFDEFVGSSPSWFGNSGVLAYLKDGRLYLRQDGRDIPVDTGDDIIEDIEGYLFSPWRDKVVVIRPVNVTRPNNKKYSDLPLATGRVIDDLMYKHWDEWTDQVPHPFIYQLQITCRGEGEYILSARMSDGKDILAGTDYECPMRPFGDVEQLAWNPNNRDLSYTCRKKTGMDYAISTNSDIYIYDTETGEEYNMTEGNGGYDTNPSYSHDGRYIAWQSMERDGYESDENRLMVRNMETGEVTWLSRGLDSDIDSYYWETDTSIIFSSVWHGRIGLYSTSLDGERKQIYGGQYDYVPIMSIDGHHYYLRHSMREANELYRDETQLTYENKNIYDQVAMGSVAERWQPTSDGKQMLTWVIYPPHFDPAKKYPTLLYCEGGPQSPVSQFWSYRWNFMQMAAHGYIIVAPNRRGLPGFGKAWNEQISGDYGGQCMKDYLSAIDEFVASEPYADKEHLGCVGASFGGYSVYWLAGHHNKRFKAFIAHDGIFNTEMQYLETEEKWFANWDLGGAYWEKDNAIAQRTYANSPHKFVDQWDTPILCIHGEKDYRILANQGMAAFDAAKMMGIPAELLIFPDENHWVLKPQNGILWQRTFFEWLDKWLK